MDSSNTPRPLIAGNWKMNGLSTSLQEAKALAEALGSEPARARVALCPPATLVDRMARVLEGSTVELGGQDCRAEAAGAFTGDISAEMLADAGAKLVILGHSERRAGYGESDLTVCGKVQAAVRAGLEPIVCVGETLEERRAGRAVEVVQSQVTNSLPDDLHALDFAVAYEPVWAIGTGRTATAAQAQEVHAFIRQVLASMHDDILARRIRIQYGGSVKASNANELMAQPDVDGALVGGASLEVRSFVDIIRNSIQAKKS